jgi:hypothetical protein
VREVGERLLTRGPFAEVREGRQVGIGQAGHARFLVRIARTIAAFACSDKASEGAFSRSVCCISAEPFVASETRSECMAESTGFVSRAHVGQVPKLRLGETHVPTFFLGMREKTLPVVVKIRYARH